MITDAEIGKRIAELRADQNMSQATLRNEMETRGHDLDVSAISRIESGQRLLKATEMVALGDIFAVPLEKLVPVESVRSRVQRLERRLSQIQRSQKCLEYESDGIKSELAALRWELVVS